MRQFPLRLPAETALPCQSTQQDTMTLQLRLLSCMRLRGEKPGRRDPASWGPNWVMRLSFWPAAFLQCNQSERMGARTSTKTSEPPLKAQKGVGESISVCCTVMAISSSTSYTVGTCGTTPTARSFLITCAPKISYGDQSFDPFLPSKTQSGQLSRLEQRIEIPCVDGSNPPLDNPTRVEQGAGLSWKTFFAW